MGIDVADVALKMLSRGGRAEKRAFCVCGCRKARGLWERRAK
jgi:hypothetical protein